LRDANKAAAGYASRARDAERHSRRRTGTAQAAAVDYAVADRRWDTRRPRRGARVRRMVRRLRRWAGRTPRAGGMDLPAGWAAAVHVGSPLVRSMSLGWVAASTRVLRSLPG